MDERIEKYRAYYQSGLWSAERIRLLLTRGIITEAECEAIMSEDPALG